MQDLTASVERKCEKMVHNGVEHLTYFQMCDLERFGQLVADARGDC